MCERSLEWLIGPGRSRILINVSMMSGKPKRRQSSIKVNGVELLVELKPTAQQKFHVVNPNATAAMKPMRRRSSALVIRGADAFESKDPNFDRYGFMLITGDGDPTSSFHKAAAVSEDVQKARTEKEKERFDKWTEMMRDLKSDNKSRQQAATSKLQERVRKGIPNGKRGEAWYYLSGAYDEKGGRIGDPDAFLVGKEGESAIPARTLDEIDRDIDRTYPRHKLFRMGPDKKETIKQASLRRILRWYAAIDPEVGYCQGMGFIAGLYLIYMDEMSAFRCFYKAMQKDSELRLRDLYLPQMVEAQRVLFIFKRLGSKHLGALWSHLEQQELDPTMYATEWAMTMFCRGFHFDLVTRVMDIYLNEGYKVVYRVMLALMMSCEEELLQSGFEGIMEILRRIPEKTDADTIVDLAYSIPVRRGDIERFSKEYEDMVAAENSKSGKL